jgi:adenylate kinase family enzyme
MPVERILIVGGPGSGKTTLALELGERLNLPVHHLDDIARVGGGRGAETSADDRATAVVDILASGRWVTEGVHLGWTAPLVDAADAIVWLDHVRWQTSSRRVIRRFLRQALAEARQRKGRERFLRFRDYARRLRELAVSLPETRSYPLSELEAALAPHGDKVFRCRTPADVAGAAQAVVSGSDG